MKGKTPSDELQTEAQKHGIFISSSKSGYIETDIFIEYLNHFQKFRTKINGKKCILILDGHSTHLSVQAIEMCQANGIEMVCLPPHSSHRI